MKNGFYKVIVAHSKKFTAKIADDIGAKHREMMFDRSPSARSRSPSASRSLRRPKVIPDRNGELLSKACPFQNLGFSSFVSSEIAFLILFYGLLGALVPIFGFP